MIGKSAWSGRWSLSALALVVALLMLPIFTVSSTSAATTGLVAAYAFNEGSGSTVADASGIGNAGATSNTTWSASGKYGGALSFNGTSARVNIPNSQSLQLATSMTLEAWVNPSTVDNNWRDVIYKGDDNYYLEATSGNGSRPDAGLIAGGSYGNAYGTAAIAANAWSFLAETYDGATLRLYLNGNQVAATAHTGAITTSTSQLADRRRQHLRPVLQGLDRQRSRLQHRAERGSYTDRHEHAGCGRRRHDAAVCAGHPHEDGRRARGGRLELGRCDRQCRRHRLPGLPVPGCRLTSYALLVSPAGTATTYKDTSVAASSSYGYEVRAVDAAGNPGAFSNTLAATTPAAPDQTPPSAPGAL